MGVLPVVEGEVIESTGAAAAVAAAPVGGAGDVGCGGKVLLWGTQGEGDDAQTEVCPETRQIVEDNSEDGIFGW